MKNKVKTNRLGSYEDIELVSQTFLIHIQDNNHRYLEHLNSYDNSTELSQITSVFIEANAVFAESRRQSPKDKELLTRTQKSFYSELLNHTKPINERCRAAKGIIKKNLKPKMAERIWVKIQRALTNVGIFLSFGIAGVIRVANNNSFWKKRSKTSKNQEKTYNTLDKNVDQLLDL